MANIFSGLFSNAGRGQAGALARYNQELKDYQDAKDAYEQQQAMDAVRPKLEAAMSEMSPAMRTLAELAESYQRNRSTFDTGSALTSKVYGQRGGIIKDKSANAEKLARFKAERDYKLATPDPLEQTSDKRNYDHYMSLGDGTATRTKEQEDWLILKRKEQQLDLGTGYASTITGEFTPKQIELMKFQEEFGEANSAQYIQFPDTLAATDNFMRNNAEKRNSVQRLYGITTEGVTGLEAVFSIIPETDAMAWDKLKSEVVANIGIDKLIEMKESSSSGASGLGALSDTEMAILIAIKGDLSQTNDPKAIKIILRRLDREYAAMATNRKRRLKQMHDKNRRMEKRKKVPQDYYYEVAPEQEYLLGVKGAVPPVHESPIAEDDAEAAEDAATSTRKKWGLE